MKKVLFSLLAILLFMQLHSIITETGSLSGFLYRTEDNCEYDDWLSHVSEGIASANYNLYAPFDRQTNGFGDYRTPNGTELTEWANVIELFVIGQYDLAEIAIASAGFPYQVVQFNDTDTGNTYYMLRENLSMLYFDDNGTADAYDDVMGSFAYGWGLYIANPNATRPVVVTVPHPTDDFSTAPFAIEAFKLWDAEYILFSGAGREVRWTNIPPFNNSKSLSDPTRVEAHPFNKAYQAFADDIRDQYNIREFSVQFHSYDWNRHEGMANTQISAGNQKYCPNLPIRDLSRFKHDLINMGDHLMIPANTYGIHSDVYHRDYYSVFYSTYDFMFSDGVNEYPVFDQITLPAYSQNRQMLYTLSGYTDYDTYEPFFHIEMDELPNCYDHTNNTYWWWYGWDEASGQWDYSITHDKYIEYYWRWVNDLNLLMDEMFAMNDQSAPLDPSNLVMTSPSYTSATLSWSRSDDYDFETYEVLYATEPIGESNYQIFDRDDNQLLASPYTEQITVTGLNNSNTYYFALRAKDKNGNYSAITNQVSTTMAPAYVSNFNAYGMHNSTRLSWNASYQTNNQGFKIYRQGGAGWEMVDSYQSNPELANTQSSYEWWDMELVNGQAYTYKISTTNTNGEEYIHNFPSTSVPSDVHTITISNGMGTITDTIEFGTNPYASDGQDTYWDQSKSGPSGSNYVWAAFWEQYWTQSGTSLSREIKGNMDPDQDTKTWVMRFRSDQLSQNLYLNASDTFGRAEKLYVQDGGTWHDLTSEPYTFSVTSTNIRTMTLYWGNLQPEATVVNQPNRVYQGGSQISFGWNYTYPFLVDDVDVWIVNETDSLQIAEGFTSSNNSLVYTVPQLADMQGCKLVLHITGIDGVLSRFEGPYTFALVPAMSFLYADAGWKTAANPWPESFLNIEETFGAGASAYMTGATELIPSTDFMFGMGYWVYNPEINFYSTLSPVQQGSLSFELYPGWNHLGNPHMCAYNTKDLQFLLGDNLFSMGEMINQELISPSVFVARNNAIVATDRIEPFESFFIKYNGSSSLAPQINFLPFNQALPVDPVDPLWQLGLQVNATNGTSDLIIVGANPRSNDEYDYHYDQPKPALIPEEMVYISLLRSPEQNPSFEENNLFSDFTSDFVSGEETMKTWYFGLWAPEAGEINLFMDMLGIPTEWTVAVYLNGEGFYSYNDPAFTYYAEEAGWITGVITIRNHYLSNEENVVAPISALMNYPNPFNPSTTICFFMNETARAKVEIFNIRGQLVQSLHDGPLARGNHNLIWDGLDQNKRSVASGVYFARISSGKYNTSHKMILIK